MLFGVRAVSKAILLSLMAEVEVTVFSKEAFSVLQSADRIAAVLMENFSLLFRNVHVVLSSFSVNVSSGKTMRYC